MDRLAGTGLVPEPDALRSAGTVASDMAPDVSDETVAMKDTDMSLTARASMASDFTDPVEWGLANAAGAGIGRVAMMHADRRFRKSGRVRCGLRVIDGNQPGLSGRWRVGVASFSARRLEFLRRWWRVLGECPPIEVIAVHGPSRAPYGDEILKLPGSIVQIQTPTAILECALHVRYQSAAVAQLKVAQWVPAEETAE